MDSRYIDTQAGLIELAADLEGSELLAVDTEFLREKTYYPKLCLIQLNNESIQAIVDPLAVHDLSPLAPIMTDQGCVKIFHSGSQDIDILFHELGAMPTPLFDTQMAAALMGFPLQVGYGPLVQALCDVRLAKADSYTDWSRRPLTTHQLKYALDDVVYLPQMYRHMVQALEKQGRGSWLDADFAKLADPVRYNSEPMEMWRKVKRVASLSRGQLAVAQELAAWREREAMERNIPRKWVIPDEAVVEIARKSPKSIDRLMEVRGLNTKLTTKTARQVLEAVKKGRERDPKDYPSLPKRPSGTPEVDGAVDLLASVVEVRSKENGVAVPVLASRDDLARLVHGHKEECEVLHGWRYEMVGRELEAIMEGRLAVYVERGKLCVAPR
ncbi:MAG: ribonuclease D [Coriobacteriales bacterium]